MEEKNSKVPVKLLGLTLVLAFLGFTLIGLGLKGDSLTTSPIVTPSINNISPTLSKNTDEGQLVLGQSEVLVKRVIDGDTIELEGGEKVRLIGIDTPETVDPRREVGCFGKEASDKAKELMEGKAVLLIKDVSETDKFGRLLRYVYVKQDQGPEIFVNEYLIGQGFARVSTFPPDVKFTELFQSVEKEARENKRGLWGGC